MWDVASLPPTWEVLVCGARFGLLMWPIGAAGRIAWTIRQRHENIAQTMADALDSPSPSPVHLQGAVMSRALLASRGFQSPSWQDLLHGILPRHPSADEEDPGVPVHGWQFFAALTVEQCFRDTVVWPRFSPTDEALLRSQSGPMSGLPFSCFPSSPCARFPSHLFRVLLLRRLWLPLPLSSRTCLCGRPLDVFGHHRAACSRSGVLGSRGFSLVSAAARVCREAGARVSTNVFVRDLDIPVGCHDTRRLEVFADGLLLFGGAQPALDTTLVSAVRSDGFPLRGCAGCDAAALVQARQLKRRTYPELSGDHGTSPSGGSRR